VHSAIAHGVGLPLSWVLAAATAAIGTLALVAPKQLAELYGAPVGARGFPFVRATGLRDIVFALILGIAAYRRDRIELLVVAAVGILLALGDFIIAWAHARRFSQPLLAHLAGALAFVVLVETLVWP
jgi:hypothetical protein